MKAFGVLRTGHRFLTRRQDGFRNQIAQSGAWVAAAMISVNALQIVRSAILARLLTPEAFGLMGICQTVIRGMDLFSETGVRPALIQRQARFEDARDTAFSITAARGLALAVFAAFFAPVAAWYFEQPLLSTLIPVLGLSLLLTGLTNISAAGLEKRLDFRRVAVMDQLGALSSFVIVVSFAYSLRSIWALVLGHVLGTLVAVLTSYLVIREWPRFRFDRKIARELFGYGRFVTGLTIVLYFTTELDNIVVGKVLGMEALGYYLVAYTVGNLPTTHISRVIARVMFPAYAALQNDMSRLRVAYRGVVQVVAAFAFAAAAAMTVLSDDIIRVVFGERWLPAAGALRVLAIFGGVRAIGAINGYLYSAIGKPNIPFYINLAKLVVIVAVIVPATRSYGLVGTSLAVTIPAVIFHVLAVGVLDRVAGVPWRDSVDSLKGPAVTSCIMALGLLGARSLLAPVGAVDLLALTVGGGATYLLMNVPLMKRLYREHWLRSPVAA